MSLTPSFYRAFQNLITARSCIVVVMAVWVPTCSTFLKLNSWLFLKTNLWETFLSRNHAFHLSSATRRLSPQAASERNGHANCVPHLWTLGCISAWERTEVVVNYAFCLSFFSFFCFLSCLSCGKQEGQKHYSCPCWISCVVLSVCISPSLAQTSTDHCTALLPF